MPFFDWALLDSVPTECVTLSTQFFMDTDLGILWQECIHIYIYIYIYNIYIYIYAYTHIYGM